MNSFDIAVVGGGASGMVAAIEAKRRNSDLRVVILERLPRIGKKLLATGNGRCNYTHRGINAELYGKSFFLPGLIRFIDDFKIEEYFRTLGVYGAADAEGRVYPLSGTAASVLDGLRLELKKLGVEILCDFSVTGIVPKKGFAIFSRKNSVTAKAVILSGGGCSQSVLGSDGSVLRIAEALGLSADPVFPALVPLKVPSERIRGMKGIRADVKASLLEKGKVLKTERGEVQFGEDTLSGICIFNLSLFYLQDAHMTVSLDLLPETDNDEVLRLLKALKDSRREAALEDFLTGLFHKRIGIRLLRDCIGRGLAEPAGILTEEELIRISLKIKQMDFPILGTAGFEKSQVTGGGIRADSLNENLEAKKIARLFVCGEMLSYAGACGGYNLTFAFASGAYAGRNCAKLVSEGTLF